ncbi:penicillin-binding transpeptidase domain-containing protein [Pseudobdellovibrio sp. HCB154]|uniref:penicillin-binding transpeptidase domain-containing protein n=1 Tax=Pseudobdellovibrio sp. HCB154 TaxID=3386277 RepID=UPI003917226D
MKSKIITLFIFVCTLWSALVFRAAYLQFVPHEKLNTLQEKQFQTVVSLPARRGNIIDRNGKELAMSSPTYSIYADPKIIEDRKGTAKFLAKVLKENQNEIYSKIKDKNKRFIWIERLVSVSQVEEIKTQKIRGLGFVEEWKRVYPNDQLLSTTLGFTGKEGQGLEGLELFYDQQLKGESKKVSMRKDARGRPLIQDGMLFTETPQGKEIKLTIDSDLQYFVETELKQALQKHEAEAAYAVVLDAKTSAIRAIASLPSFNPNDASKVSPGARRNRSVTDTYEPGSTLKTFVIAQALEEKLFQPNSKIWCENGHFKIGKRVIREAEANHSQGLISVSEVLAYSSNIGTSKIALKLGDEKLRQGLMKFGFGQKAGTDLPGEAKGIILGLPWRDHLLANVSFGQGMTASPLQMANAYAVIANGGMLNAPHIVESITDLETNQTMATETKQIRRVISEETAQQMRLMLAAVTSGKGSGVSARVEGYIVGGKTGTAQKVRTEGRGYIPGGYIGSFTGFIPANDPQYVIYVALDHPKKGYYGAQVAAPLFSRIASYAVRREGVAPEVLGEKNISNVPVAQSEKTEKEVEEFSYADLNKTTTTLTTVPDFKDLSMREVLQQAANQNIKIKMIGRGKVDQTVPAAGEALSEDRTMTIILKE